MLTDEQQRLIASIKGPRVTRLELTKIGPDGHVYVETLDGDGAALWQAYTQSTGVLAHAHGARAPFGSLNWQRRSTPSSVRAAAEEIAWCNNCGSKDIVVVREFATAEQFIDAYNAAADSAGEEKN